LHFTGSCYNTPACYLIYWRISKTLQIAEMKKKMVVGKPDLEKIKIQRVRDL